MNFSHNFLRTLFSFYNRFSLSSKFFDGEVEIDMLFNTVEIFRDEWSVPHVFSKTNKDLLFTQGWLHAQDRLWQMEINRRMGMGQLSESFGKEALDTDRLIRVLGFNRLGLEDYKIMSPGVKSLCESYVSGINEYIVKSSLPVEFKLAGIKPRPWTVVDVLCWTKAMSWMLSHGWSSAMIKKKVVDAVGEEMSSELSIKYPKENPVEIDDIELDLFESASGPYLFKDMDGGGRGSNAWAVSSDLTTEGCPILCNDTHLKLTAPGIWYTNHLRSEEGYSFYGSSIPGIPGCFSGHNESIALGLTLAYTDVEDLFVETIDMKNPERYLYNGDYRKMDICKEVIKVKGEEDHIEKVLSTLHGPIISRTLAKSAKYIALSSKSLQPSKSLDGLWKINCAQNWTEFSQGVSDISATQLNFIYSDVDNNIGLYISGRVPIRKEGKGDFPVDGSSDRFEWHDEISHSDMPSVFNPRKKYIISTNNKITNKKYPHYLGNSFMNGYRAKRIEEMIVNARKIDINTCKDMQQDLKSVQAEIVVNGMVRGLKSSDPKIQIVIDLLENWDFVLSKDSSAAAAYQVFVYNLCRYVIEPKLGKELTNLYMGQGFHVHLVPTHELLGHTLSSVVRMFKNKDSKWISSNRIAIEIIEKSLLRSYEILCKSLGEKFDNWKWGDLHTSSFEHSLSVKSPLDKIFNISGFRLGGDSDTVFQSAYNPNAPYKATSWCAVNRYIMTVGKWSDSIMISVPGQSGVLGSMHYDDMVNGWLSGEYIPMLWEKEEIEKKSKHCILLKPEI